jgi:hypothetical protein
MAKKIILNLDSNQLNSDWLGSMRILKDKKKSKIEKRAELAERELEELVEFDDLEEK